MAMTFLRKKVMGYCGLAALSSAVVAGAAAGIAIAVNDPGQELDFIVAMDRSVSTLNYLHEYQFSATWLVDNTVEGFFSVRLPSAQSPVPAVVGLPPVMWDVHERADGTLGTADEPGTPMVLNEIYAPGMAESAEIFADTNDAYSLRLKIRNDGYWSNGTQVTADDFIDIMKYALVPSSGSTVNQYFGPYKGYLDLQKLVEATPNLTIADMDREPFAKYFAPPASDGSGGMAYAQINRNAAGEIVDQTVTLRFAYTPSSSSPRPSLTDTTTIRQRLTTGMIYYPISRAFVEGIGGFNKYGLSADTVLANGPFVMDEIDFDFGATYSKNPRYWDAERTLPKRWARRVIKNPTTAQSLFKTGKIANVAISPEAYKVYSSDPAFAQYLRFSGNSALMRGWFFNMDLGPNREYTRNVHLRRALKFATDRGGVIKAQGYDGTPPEDFYNAPIPDASDENGVYFRELFRKPTNNGSFASKTFSYDGFQQDMIYYDTKSLAEIQKASGLNKQNISVDPDYNPSLAKREFERFEQDRRDAGLPLLAKYPLRVMLSTAIDEQSIVYMQQTITAAIGDRIEFQPFYVTAGQRDENTLTMGGNFDMYLWAWFQDTNDPYSNLRVFNLIYDPASDGAKYNVSFTGFLTFTNPNGNSNPNQFSMMDDMEDTLGNPTDEASFAKAMKDVYGIDWIAYDDWKNTKTRLVDWQLAHVAQRLKRKAELEAKGVDTSNFDASGVVNAETDLLARDDLNLSFWLSHAFKVGDREVPAIPISVTYRYYAILEMLLRLYMPSVTTLQAANIAYATTIVGAEVAPTQYFTRGGIQYKLTYVCTNPPASK